MLPTAHVQSNRQHILCHTCHEIAEKSSEIVPLGAPSETLPIQLHGAECGASGRTDPSTGIGSSRLPTETQRQSCKISLSAKIEPFPTVFRPPLEPLGYGNCLGHRPSLWSELFRFSIANQ